MSKEAKVTRNELVHTRKGSQTSVISSILEEEAVCSSPDGRFLKYDKLIGDGSFKTVYTGYETETGIFVAWCELKDRNISKEDRERFKIEAMMLSKLDHPNIVKYFDFFEIERPNKKPLCVLITEMVESGTLKDYLKHFSPLSVKILKNWCVQILKALAFLHSRSPPIIHRDLKCDNIFINGGDGNLKLGDLGLATNKCLQYPRSVIGTPEFMAPEMYKEYYDQSVDVYAFGMCVLEIVTGEYPYSECTNVGQIYRLVSSGEKPKVLEKVTCPIIKEIIEKCIDFDKKQRYSVKELLNLDYFKEEPLESSTIFLPSPNLTFSIQLLETTPDQTLNLRLTQIFNDNIADQKEEKSIDFRYLNTGDSPQSAVSDLVQSGVVPLNLSPEICASLEKFIAGIKTDLKTEIAQSLSKTEIDPKNLKMKKSNRRLIRVCTIFGETDSKVLSPSKTLSKIDIKTNEPVYEEKQEAQTKSDFLILYLKDVINETLVECGLEAINSTKLTFKFSIKDDLPSEITLKLVKTEFLESGYLKNFESSLEAIVTIAKDFISKSHFGLKHGPFLKVFPDSQGTALNKEILNNLTELNQNLPSGKTQKIDISHIRLQRSEPVIIFDKFDDLVLPTAVQAKIRHMSETESETDISSKRVVDHLSSSNQLESPVNLISLSSSPRSKSPSPMSDRLDYSINRTIYHLNQRISQPDNITPENLSSLSRMVSMVVDFQNRKFFLKLLKDTDNQMSDNIEKSLQNFIQNHVKEINEIRNKQLDELKSLIVNNHNDLPKISQINDNQKTIEPKLPIAEEIVKNCQELESSVKKDLGSMPSKRVITDDEFYKISMEEIEKLGKGQQLTTSQNEHKPSLNELREAQIRAQSSQSSRPVSEISTGETFSANTNTSPITNQQNWIFSPDDISTFPKK